jgi:hypothetical protein
MRRLVVPILIALLVVSGVAARQAVNYLIRGISSKIIGDQIAVEFTVINGGDSVTSEQPAHLFDSNGTVVASQTVRPLGKNQNVQIILTVPLSQFAPGTSQTIYAGVGLDQLPPQNGRTLGNIGTIEVVIPPTAAQATPEVVAPVIAGLPINLHDSTNLALVIGIIVVVIVLLWVFTVIGRLLFSRPAALPVWQPPYVMTPLIDPNSTNGRRQLWQRHAESDVLPPPRIPGDFKVRKLLLGSNGVKLAGWRVTGMRIGQYDPYGPVKRSQTVLPKKIVKALDRAVRKSASLDSARAIKAARPIAKMLTKTMLKKTTRQSATLPVALDIRLMGMHGEVRILFELYGSNGASWQEIDHWEPEMGVVNGSIYENFTYTLLGQYPAETRKQYRQRLQNDLTNVLAAMVQAPPPPPPPPSSPPPEDTAETAAVTE